MPLSSISLLLLALQLSSGITASPIAAQNAIIRIPLSSAVDGIDGAEYLGTEPAQTVREVNSTDLFSGASSPVSINLMPPTPYIIVIQVGTEKNQYKMAVDNAASITWLKSVTSSSQKVIPEKIAEVRYRSDQSITGPLYTDTIELGPTTPGLLIKDQSVMVATNNPFNDRDGQLGLAPVRKTVGMLKEPYQEDPVPTILDNLFSQGQIVSYEFSLYIEPLDAAGMSRGEVIFGGAPDPQLWDGDITPVSVTSISPASLYWGIDMAMTYGENNAAILPTQQPPNAGTPEGPAFLTAPGVLDIGNPSIRIASDAFQRYLQLAGATQSQIPMLKNQNIFEVTPEKYDVLQTVYLRIGPMAFKFPKEAQRYSETSTVGKVAAPNISLIIRSSNRASGVGNDFNFGSPFLRRFYTNYNAETNEVGIAYAKGLTPA